MPLAPEAGVGRGSAVGARLFPLVPRGLARRLSTRYIAGQSTEEAVRVATRLRQRGLLATLDILGESVLTEQEAAAYADEYVDALAALDDAGLDPHVSVKPSALGSLVDWALCERHVARIARAAEIRGGTVCLDMEWAGSIDGTLDLYRSLRTGGHENVTVVVQTRLHRATRDLRALAPLAPRVRICKGIYQEPARTAYTDAEAIRRNFLFCLHTVLEAGGYPEVATHDEALVVGALERLSIYRRRPETYELQMLLGVRDDLAEGLAAAGHRIRVYVPYGSDWHRYAVRRFRESPQVLGHVGRELGRRALTRVVRDRRVASHALARDRG